MIIIAIILGSTREGRQGEKVARWLEGLARARSDFRTEFIDLGGWALPFLSSAIPPASPDYRPKGIVTQWSEKIAAADGFIVVTPEYNHGYPAVLKNALDHLYREWNRKPIAFVSYGGSAGGARAVEQLRQVAIEFQMAPIREAIHIAAIRKAFDEAGSPVEAEALGERASVLFDQLLWWAEALRQARSRPA